MICLLHGSRPRDQFRFTRNSDLFVDEEEVDDLLRALEGELPDVALRRRSPLEVTHDAPRETIAMLVTEFGLDRRRTLPVPWGGQSESFVGAAGSVDRPDRKFPGFIPWVTPNG